MLFSRPGREVNGPRLSFLHYVAAFLCARIKEYFLRSLDLEVSVSILETSEMLVFS